jgi:hypothetical protein
MDFEYVEKKCLECKQVFEVRVDKSATLYGSYCPICFRGHVIEDIYGELRLLEDDEKIKDKSYKDELQEPTHRGKMGVEL